MSSTRRQFLGGATGTGLAMALGGRALASGTLLGLQDAPRVPRPISANDRIRFACIGVGGKGESDTADAARFGDIVAICDVDENTLNKAGQKYPNARRFNDFRRLFDAMGDQIDAVTVSTPDHNHAVAAATAMLLGKHCFCQKPLTHYLWEARQLQEIARKTGLATQMGNQGTADSGLRKRAAQVRAGMLGHIKEIHVWTNRPIWPQGQQRPAPTVPPLSLNWDTWLGPAAARPFAPGYHTFSWRGFWDFGTGALGDMGCHTLNMPYMALDLRAPKTVVAETAPNNRDTYPEWSIVTYTFEKTRERPGLKLYWYDGKKKPSADVIGDLKIEDSGSLLIGEKGRLYLPGDYGGGGRLIGIDEPENVPTYPVSPGHFDEYVRAIRGGEPAMSNFPGYSGPLAETVLLGNLAVWNAGSTIEWDARQLRAKGGAADTERMIRPEYRRGWDLIPDRV